MPPRFRGVAEPITFDGSFVAGAAIGRRLDAVGRDDDQEVAIDWDSVGGS